MILNSRDWLARSRATSHDLRSPVLQPATMNEDLDSAIVAVRWIDLMVLVRLAGKDGVATPRELASWPRYPAWRVRRSLRRLRDRGVVVRAGPAFEFTSDGRQFARAALASTAIAAFEAD